jgi:hypothetical protein
MPVALALLLVAMMATAAGAQRAPEQEARVQSGPADAAQDAFDPSKMGVSLKRIVRGLKFEEERAQRPEGPLRIEYQIQVFGQAPRIDLLDGFDLEYGPLQYGAPTHNDFINYWTPQAFKSPPIPVSAIAGWALLELGKRAQKAKCEQAIADYRALVMQGVSVAAPSCTQ